MNKPPESCSRRGILQTLMVGRAVLPVASLLSGLHPLYSMDRQGDPSGSLLDVPSIKIGHYTESLRPTGCTVILLEKGAAAGVDVRGSAPGTRETDLLGPMGTVEKIHAILFSGGSAFGLDAAAGVMQYLEEKGIGYETPAARVPIVPAAILYDLELGDSRIRPDKKAGYLACKAASDKSCPEGNVGAGNGATVGKLFGLSRAMKGGLGTSSIRIQSVVVAALVVVNAFGDVIDKDTGKILAGARSSDGEHLVNTVSQLLKGNPAGMKPFSTNTTIGVVATNLALSKVQANKVAQMAQDGLARSINPVHTPYDGDTLFVVGTGEVTEPVNLMWLGSLAAEVVAQAVRRAVIRAESLPGLPNVRDFASPRKPSP